MRNAFARALETLGARDERVILLSGDIGNRMFDDWKGRFPERFANCGIAEANMIGVAAGLAMSGLRPVVYTIAPFLTSRALEAIKLDLCYHELPVVVVGVGAGLSYASLGATHQSCDDLASLRVLPGMTVVCPGDALEVPGALRAALACDGPVYLRLGKKGEPVVHAAEPAFEIGRSIPVAPGTDVALLSVGNVLPMVVEAAAQLRERGLSVRVESFHTVKPLDERCLAEVFSTCDVVATIEEHSRLGGAGGAVAEWCVARARGEARLVVIGTDDRFLCEAGSQTHVREQLGLSPDAIAKAVLDAFAEDELDEIDR